MAPVIIAKCPDEYDGVGLTIGMAIDEWIALPEDFVTFPMDGGRYDPEEYPELVNALRGLGFAPGRLPDGRPFLLSQVMPSVDGESHVSPGSVE